jgi:CheY-like chemotaxis protein
MGDPEIVPEPVRQKEQDEESFANYSQRPIISGRWSRLNKKVLVVDDNEVNLLVAQRMLEELGFEVDLAANGLEAIDAAAADDDYAAILIDSQMPGMDGNEATRIIRLAEGDKQHTPIIALTANAMVPDRERAFAAGVDDYLCKPVFLEDLEVVLGRLLTGDDDTALGVATNDLRSTRESTESVINMRIVAELSKIEGPGEAGLFSELASQMIEQMPGWLHEIETAASNGDAKSVRRQAHKLLGMCLQIGAERMANVCHELESMDTPLENSDMLNEIELLHIEFDYVDQELRKRHLL